MKSAVLAMSLLIAGCGAEAKTEVVVIVRSDLAASALQSAHIRVVRAADRASAPLFASPCQCVGDAPCSSLPLTLGLLAENSSSDRFSVTATGFSDGSCNTFSAEQSATLQFVRHQTLALELALLSACKGVHCNPGTTCVDASGACVADDRNGLPAFTPALLDGGVGADLAGGDAGVQLPTMRTGSALAYDSQRARTVLFGGAAPQDLGDTWEWDGASWHAIHAGTGPLPRDGHSMVYDSVRRRVVLFGGSGAAGAFGDTWAWDGTSWSLLATSGPSPRYHAAMAFDAQRSRVVLFGGEGALGDTWELDGTSWTARANSGPPGRESAAMAWDANRHVSVLFGGSTVGGNALGDTWEWNGSGWTQSAAVAPPPRANHGMTFDTARNVVLLFGGFDGNNYLPGLWSWDGASWTSLPASGGPHGRVAFGFTFDSTRARAILFGGFYGGLTFADTWEWDSSLDLWMLR